MGWPGAGRPGSGMWPPLAPSRGSAAAGADWPRISPSTWSAGRSRPTAPRPFPSPNRFQLDKLSPELRLRMAGSYPGLIPSRRPHPGSQDASTAPGRRLAGFSGLLWPRPEYRLEQGSAARRCLPGAGRIPAKRMQALSLLLLFPIGLKHLADGDQPVHRLKP
jgi:hypothetical protein